MRLIESRVPVSHYSEPPWKLKQLIRNATSFILLNSPFSYCDMSQCLPSKRPRTRVFFLVWCQIALTLLVWGRTEGNDRNSFTGKQTNLMASHSLEVSDGVADGVHSHVAHVQSPRRVRKHGEDIKLLLLWTLRKQNMGWKNVRKTLFEFWEIPIMVNPSSVGCLCTICCINLTKSWQA